MPIEGQMYCVKAEFIAANINTYGKYLFDVKKSKVNIGKKVSKSFLRNINFRKIETLKNAVIVAETFEYDFKENEVYNIELEVLPNGVATTMEVKTGLNLLVSMLPRVKIKSVSCSN